MRYLKRKLQDEIYINKSRFITYLIPVFSIEEVSESLSTIRKTHYNATHHCYGYILNKQTIQKSSDDGEPAGTAGVPILQVLLTQNLDNILAVVVRYYGGIQLGKGGLIRAYSNGVSDLLKKASFYKEALKILYKTMIPYTLYDQVNYYLKEHAHILKLDFLEHVSLEFYFTEGNVDDFLDYFNHQISVDPLYETLVKIPEISSHKFSQK